jgi:hypothetical protein
MPQREIFPTCSVWPLGAAVLRHSFSLVTPLAPSFMAVAAIPVSLHIFALSSSTDSHLHDPIHLIDPYPHVQQVHSATKDVIRLFSTQHRQLVLLRHPPTIGRDFL